MKHVFCLVFKPIWSLSCLFLILSCFQAVIAEERTYDPSDSLVILSHEKSNAHWTGITEDLLIIDGTPYKINGKTEFYKQMESGRLEKTPMKSFTFPCRVNIGYKTFSVYTEDYPYHPDDRLLVRVVVKDEMTQRNAP